MKAITKKTHKYARNQGISYKSFLRNLPEDKLHSTKEMTGDILGEGLMVD